MSDADIFKDTDIPLVDEDEEEDVIDDEDEELDALEKDNEDEEIEDDNDNDNDDDDGEVEEDEEDEEIENDNEDENDAANGNMDVDIDEDQSSENINGSTTTTNEKQNPSDEITDKSTESDAKLQNFFNTVSMKARIADSYDVAPIVAVPYSSQIHSVALSGNSKWLFTGGDDGFIRKYDFLGSIDGEVQLTAAQKHNLVDLISNGGAITGYWENEIPQQRSLVQGDAYEPKTSPVYSLAVEKNGLWLLSGLANGGITMQSVRHNEGAIIHYFKKHTDTVSVLELNYQQDHFVSGGWDKMLNLWDLNTGSISRSFTDATGQITAVQYRPTGGINIDTIKQQAPADDDDLDSLFGSEDVGNSNEEIEQPGVTNGQPIDDNILLSATIDGCVSVLDIRAEKPVLKIRSPKGTPPWCVSACWSESGDSIFVGRRNSTVEEFSLKMPFFANGDSRPSKTLRFPQVSGAVTAVKALPNHNHVLCASHDNIRVYDLRLYSEAQKKTPFLIVPGHHGGVISNVLFDPTYRYMVSASGNRGWQGTSTETVFIYDVGSE